MENYNVSNLYPEPMKADPQKTKAIEEIRFHIKRAHKAQEETVKDRKVFIVVGMLSLAKSLDIITSDEYEALVNELHHN